MYALRKISFFIAVFIASNIFGQTQVWAPFFTVNGQLKASGLKYPTVDGSAGQALVTDGNKTLYFTTIGAGASAWTLSSGDLYPTNTAYQVGIGQTSAFRALDVLDPSGYYPARFTGNSHCFLEIRSNGNYQAGFRFMKLDTTLWYIDNFGNNNDRLRIRDSTGTTEVFAIRQGGYVGFGKYDSGAFFHVYGAPESGSQDFVFEASSGHTQFVIENDAGNSYDASIHFVGFGTNTWDIGLDDSDNDKFIINRNGSYGLTTDQKFVLETNGIITVDSIIYHKSQIDDSVLATKGWVNAHSGGDFSAADFGDSLLNYDGDGLTITDNDAIDVNIAKTVTDAETDSLPSSDAVYDFCESVQDYVTTSETASWDKNATDDLMKAHFGDSLLNYDGAGLTILDNNAINVNIAKTITDNETDSLPSSNAVYDFCESEQDYHKTSEFNTVST
ncbi:MAG: hypothetical protein JSW07_07055, partial [bacterium]